MKDTQAKLLSMIEAPPGVKVLVLRQACALSPEKKGKKQFEVEVDGKLCLGESCGCNRLCSTAPARRIWDKEAEGAGGYGALRRLRRMRLRLPEGGNPERGGRPEWKNIN